MRLNQSNQAALISRLCNDMEIDLVGCLHALPGQDKSSIEVTMLEVNSRTPEDLILWCVDHKARLEVLTVSSGRCTYGLYPTGKGGFRK